MAAGKGFDLGCDKEFAAMKLGDMGGRVEELTSFDSGEDVGDLGGVEAVGAEELKER